MNDAMLDLARRASSEVAATIGFANVSFHRGRIQDLALDLDRIDAWLRDNPVRSASDISAFEDALDLLRREHPMIPDASIDIVVSNCVLNLVRESDKPKLIREIFRVLKPGGRIAISDIVSDEAIPDDLKADADLWSGCVSGAFEEKEILGAMEGAGFYGIAIDRWGPVPFRTVRGIEFRAVTITARKGKEGPCFEANQAVIYRGPWKQVEDDDHHLLRRGERAAVCAKTFRILTSEPYASSIIAVPPHAEIPESDRVGFDCSRTAPRHPRETKGLGYDVTTAADGPCCDPGECC
jgi:SAM-dependent methyltransferase